MEKSNKKNKLLKSELNSFKLDYILEITQLINLDSSEETLFNKFEDLLKEKLFIGKALLIVKEKNTWNRTIKYGFKNEYFNVDVENQLAYFKEIITIDNSFQFNPFDFLIPILHKNKTLGYLFLGDLDDDALELSATIKHLNYIQTITNILLVAIENNKLSNINFENHNISRDMQQATEVHSMLFPKNLPFNSYVKFASYYLPHHFIGGDYYDVFSINENEYIFCIADVSGKGISAALLTANLQANLHAITNFNTSLVEVVNELNNKIVSITRGDRFITLFLAKYNIVTKVLSYINSGHLPVFLKNSNGVEKLKTGTLGIGMFDDIPEIIESSILITEPTSLLLYTDGVIETENMQSEPFGLNKLEEFIINDVSDNIIQQNAKIINKLDTFKERQNYNDDITLLNCLLE